MDVCQPCVEDIYATVMADIAGALFSLQRDIAAVREAVAGLARHGNVRRMRQR